MREINSEKDGREELSFNYQISLLHRNENNAGDFVTFSNLFGKILTLFFVFKLSRTSFANLSILTNH